MNDNFFAVKPDSAIYKFSPWYNFHFYTCDLDTQLMGSVSKYILSIEKKVINQFPLNESLSYNLDSNLVNSRFMLYNLFTLEDNVSEIKTLKNSIKEKVQSFLDYHNESFADLYIACWFIILRSNQSLPTHTHDNSSKSYISGNLTVSCTQSSTEYILPYDHGNFSVKNKVGGLTLFPSCLAHHTTKHCGLEPRISIAFDIFPTLENCKKEYINRFVKL